MPQAPHIPEDERLALMRWLLDLTATPSVRVLQLFRTAYERAAQVTGLSVPEVERSMGTLEGAQAAQWVEYFLNEYRKTGSFPEPPEDHA